MPTVSLPSVIYVDKFGIAIIYTAVSTAKCDWVPIAGSNS
jgi:hypothetical protein